MPLYFVIGRSSFGKSTLLANSGLDLKDASGNKVHNEFSTKHCVWLFSPQATFLDTAGIYTKSDKDSPHANLVWLGFLRFLQGRFLHNPISGVIAVIDIPTLLGDKEQLLKALNDLKERLYEISRHVEKLPIYIVFTKTDVIPGFTDFFADLTPDEREQPLGIAFAQNGMSVNPQVAFSEEFACLMLRLRERLWQRLQKEKNLLARQRAGDFVVQFGGIRTAIKRVLDEMPYGGHIELQGCYFVSALQKGEHHDWLQHNLSEALNSADVENNNNHIATIVTDHFHEKSQTYFISGFFDKLILKAKLRHSIMATLKVSKAQLLLVIGTALILIISSSLWYKSYISNVQAFTSIIKNFNDSNHQDNVVRMEQAISNLNTVSSAWWTHLGLNQLGKFNYYLNKIYQHNNSAAVVMRLKKTLEEELTFSNIADYQYLYDTLKTYLMLSDPTKLDVDFVQSWFMQYWQKKYSNDVAMQKRLLTQLTIVLHQKAKIEPSSQIINMAREMLGSHNVPKEELIYAALEKDYSRQKLKFKFADKEIIIPKIYTADNFSKIYAKQIPDIVYTLSNKSGDWVMYSLDSAPTVLQHGEMSKIVTNLRATYIKKYVEVWNEAAHQIRVDKADNLKNMQHLLEDIASSDYPLISFIKSMQFNLNVKGAPDDFITAVDVNLSGIRNTDLKPIYNALDNLALYLAKINGDADESKASFLAAVARFNTVDNSEDAVGALRKLSLQQSPLIREWLLSIVDNSWKLILVDAQKYINAMWETKVLPEYKELIVDTYPFYKDATKSISFTDLARFFATGGVMDNFFNNYLRPFVDVDQVYWTWKSVDDKRLEIGQDKLEIFIRAALMRKMFYAQGGSMPSVKFSLIGQALTPGTQHFDLNLNGQMITYVKGQRPVNNVMWPGPNPTLVSAVFVSGKNKSTNMTMPNDEWSWFRLLDRSNLRVLDGTQHFAFTIDLNGNAVKYNMDVEQAINPFIPAVINNFRCPDKL